MTKKIKIKISSRLLKKKTRRSSVGTAKTCRFFFNPESRKQIDYKNKKGKKGKNEKINVFLFVILNLK